MACRVPSTIVCGNEHGNSFTMSLSNNGEVYSVGRRVLGAHGQEEEIVFPPKKISSLPIIKAIDSGAEHAICLDIEGNIYSFGMNAYGQLGVGLDHERFLYTHLPQKLDLPLITQFSCGEGFTICLSEDGELYSFGENRYGQLGHEDMEYYNYPKKIEKIEKVEFVECGNHFVICKKENGNIYGWGYNEYNQLSTCDCDTFPYRICNWPKNIVDIKCGDNHTLVLTSNQTVYACGSNHVGQLGIISKFQQEQILRKIDTLSEIVRISCGYNHSMCIDAYDNLYIFGHNYRGQLGLGDTDNRNIPIKHPSLSNVIDISSRGDHTFVKTLPNKIFSFGDNVNSQLGFEKVKIEQLDPIQVFKKQEDIWCTHKMVKSKAKSARSVYKVSTIDIPSSNTDNQHNSHNEERNQNNCNLC